MTARRRDPSAGADRDRLAPAAPAGRGSISDPVAESPSSPVLRVQLMQALVARELVEGFRLPERQAAVLLGIGPSSISQYLSGKRLAPTLAAHFGHEPARRIARRVAQRLLDRGTDGPRALLEAALELDELGRGGAPGAAPKGEDGGDRRDVPRWLAQRIAGEQQAVAECMRLAQRSRDELTRALFRQIASDSLRHAEIVASLAAYLDRGVATSIPTGITRRDVERLIEDEHRAEASSGQGPGPELGGVMKVLWESMEADERKHELLLEALLGAGLPDRLEETDRRPTAAAGSPPKRPRAGGGGPKEGNEPSVRR